MIDPIRLALPSKGELADGILELLSNAGFRVKRASSRQYEARISGAPRFHVVFMRPTDIVTQVQEGRCHLGVTGCDVYTERVELVPDTAVVVPDLGYGGCRLVVAVPESWIDVSHLMDLVDLTSEYKSQGRSFRVSTKYPALTKAHFRERGIYHYQIVESDGALELHPSLGIADIIVDLTSSGATLKDNRLKQIEGGTILDSSAIMIGHRPSLLGLIDEGDRSPLALLLDGLDGSMVPGGLLHLEVVGGPADAGRRDAAAVAKLLAEHRAQQIVQGEVWDVAEQPGWRVTALIGARDLVGCQRSLFAMGANRVVGIPVRFVFDRSSGSTFDRLRQSLGAGG